MPPVAAPLPAELVERRDDRARAHDHAGPDHASIGERLAGVVLLHRARSGTALLLKVHGMYNAANDALIRQVKRAQKWYAQRKLAAKKAAVAT